MGNISKKGKIWKVLLLAIFSSWFFNRTLSLNDKKLSLKYFVSSRNVSVAKTLKQDKNK